ncbi:hypothetical protein [Candidatus Albibeggiatoa sp. nov. NOAA]|uniref:hypothetical protein n=1 Tax=Candidatus Albibeggiatoa sp. nov. NOAA TaxID=3162724 RepID=UPI003302C5D5|nr:hypothetical protein [Thiotrichaceae bacterium]
MRFAVQQKQWWFMTNVGLINVYLEGFRAAHYDKQSVAACPYKDDAQKVSYWRKGHDYAMTLNNSIQGLSLLEQP